MDDETFTVLVLSVVIIAATCGPLSLHFHKLSKQSLACDGRTLQHSRHDPELCILACLSQEDTVPSLISLLHASHATKRSPITFYLLHLVELVGLTSPLLLSYTPPKFHANPTTTDRIANTFNYYTAHDNPHSSFHLFTSIAPFATMHEDICALATDKLVSLVVVPFHKRPTIDGTTMNESRPIAALNLHVLRDAPCSVGILVEHRVPVSRMLPSKLVLNVAVLLLGGRDDREALAHAERIAVNPSVQMTVLRCIPACAGEGRERSLDEETMGQFRVACMDNERVAYKEKESSSGEETVSAIRSMGGEFDLFLVGRGPETETQMTSGLLQWNEHPELGLIGDFLASPDYRGASSVLVVQQQPRSGPEVVPLNECG